MNTRTVLTALPWLTLVLTAGQPATALAQHAAIPLVIGGTTWADNTSYTYLGAIRPIWGGTLGSGWHQNLIASYLTYSYDIGGPPDITTIDAKAPGLDAGLGYAWNGGEYSIDLSLAVGYRDFRLSPDVDGEEPNGGEVAVTPQLQARYQFAANWDTDLLSNYSIGPDGNFNRLRLGCITAADWRLGPEFIFQEGENYRNRQLGLFLAMPLPDGLRLEFSGGEVEEKSGDRNGYLGLAFSKVF